MNLDDPLDDSQTSTNPFGFIVHFIEQLEDFIVLARIYSNAVVLTKKFSVLHQTGNLSLCVDEAGHPYT